MDFGFVGPTYTTASIYQDTQRCVNWYPEIDKLRKDRGQVALYPTEGLISLMQFPATAPVRALWVLPGSSQALGVCGNGLYTVSAGFAYNLVGTLTTSAGPVSITDNGVQAYLCDGPNRYTYTIIGGSFATIPGTDGAFAGGNTCGYSDSFIFYNQPGANAWAATASGVTTTPALSSNSKYSTTDNIVAVFQANDEVFVLGERNTEAWVNTGAFPFPFQRIPGTIKNHGCAAPFSVARLGEGFAFLAKDDRDQCIVAMMVGYEPTRISNHAVESAISKYAVVSDAIGMSYRRAGHEFYVLTFPTADATWVFDLATGVDYWHERAWQDSMNVLHRHRANCMMSFQGMTVVGDWQNGQLYQLAFGTYTDAGQQIYRLRRAVHLTQELKRVHYSRLQLQFQPGVGLVTGQGSIPQAMLQWSDDGGSTWSSEHWKSIGTIGAYKNRAIWRRMGMARDRVYQVAITDPVNAVIVSAELTAIPAMS